MSMLRSIKGKFYEFFAGGGIVRAGLGPSWTCLFANDIDNKKASAYVSNWGEKEFQAADVAKVSTVDLPGRADLAWASFPCQDFSLAGRGAGLNGARSGAFWPFWDLMKGLARESRLPDLVAIENVGGAFTAHRGHDFAVLSGALAGERYRFGAVVIDAVHFVPQSRRRLFLIGVHENISLPKDMVRDAPMKAWSPNALLAAAQSAV